MTDQQQPLEGRISRAAAAQRLGCSLDTVKRHEREGKISPAVIARDPQSGRNTGFVVAAEVEELAGQRVTPARARLRLAPSQPAAGAARPPLGLRPPIGLAKPTSPATAAQRGDVTLPGAVEAQLFAHFGAAMPGDDAVASAVRKFELPYGDVRSAWAHFVEAKGLLAPVETQRLQTVMRAQIEGLQHTAAELRAQLRGYEHGAHEVRSALAVLGNDAARSDELARRFGALLFALIARAFGGEAANQVRLHLDECAPPQPPVHDETLEALSEWKAGVWEGVSELDTYRTHLSVRR